LDDAEWSEGDEEKVSSANWGKMMMDRNFYFTNRQVGCLLLD
jgi:hypothetical protein